MRGVSFRWIQKGGVYGLLSLSLGSVPFGFASDGDEERELSSGRNFSYKGESRPLPPTPRHGTSSPVSGVPLSFQAPESLLLFLRSRGLEKADFKMCQAFLEGLPLKDRIRHNLHGSLLDLTLKDWPLEDLLEIFSAVETSQSLQKIKLSRTILTAPSYLALAKALSLNRSLTEIDLTKSPWPPKGLLTLAVALQTNKTLEILWMGEKFESKELEDFYEGIASNRSLKFISWPEPCFKVVTKIAKSNPVAMVYLGTFYLQNKDLKKARLFFERAYESHNHPVAAYELGRLSETEGQVKNALEWYKKAANLSYAPAEYLLVEYYRAVWPQDRPFLDAPDYQNALYWCQKSAAQGYIPALYRLGRIYESGAFRLLRDKESALEKAGHSFFEASLRGHLPAFEALAALCQNPAYAHAYSQSSVFYLAIARSFGLSEETATWHLKNYKK